MESETVGSQTLRTARSFRFRETGENGLIGVIRGTVREGRLKVAYASSSRGPVPSRRILYAFDVGRAERNRNLEPNSIVRIAWRKLIEFQCSERIPCKFTSGEAEIVLNSVQAGSKVAICLVTEYTPLDLPDSWYLEDYMILRREYPESEQLKTFAKKRNSRQHPEAEQSDSYGTDGETAGRMATMAKFQSISQDQSAYNHWVGLGQMRVQLKIFAKQCKKREYRESEQTDSYGTDGEAAGRMATMAKFQSISQDQSAYNHWVGQMRVQLKFFAKQCKKREYPESDQTGSYGTDGETAGHMATMAKFQSISQDQSAYNHWVGQMRVQLKNFAKQCKKREHRESEQTDSYVTDGEAAGHMATMAKFQSISQDQSAYNHWVGQMRVQLKTFAKQRKIREHPESEQTDSYGTDGETAGRMATMAKFQSISKDQSAYNHWVQLKTFAKQRKKREYPKSEQTDSCGTDGQTVGRMATSAKFQNISQDQAAYNHWVGPITVQLKTFAKQRKIREFPESEQTDSCGTDGAGRMATSAKFQSILRDQSAYNHGGTDGEQDPDSDQPQSEETEPDSDQSPRRCEVLPLVPDQSQREENAKGCPWSILIWFRINPRQKRSLVHPEPDPDPPTCSKEPSKISKCRRWVRMMLLFVALVEAVALAACVARE